MAKRSNWVQAKLCQSGGKKDISVSVLSIHPSFHFRLPVGKAGRAGGNIDVSAIMP